ncbi:hypothetical protein FSP39_023624 [Pinctada imbricata]|uniref:Activin types I and II receptor domain-containing protein n=1 Tax=Pinctada imbricata TaxID=66713 RepID=A0AA89CB85_PINIB|nr:hypothetical protein FSP39_023624 [Pinctada imbricata]
MFSKIVFFLTGLKCDCTTDECLDKGTRTCHGNYCYSETYNNIVENGCMEDWSQLLCENRHSAKLRLLPQRVAFCCSNRDFCNKNIVPTKAPKKDIPPFFDDKPYSQHTDAPDCPCAQSKKDNSKMINPIYIAVPVAGVCVLLALIIFAMYLLRRRNVYYDRYQYPRTISAHAPPSHQLHHQHINSSENKCSAAACKINRCTDSERSSSGSESKLFI